MSTVLPATVALDPRLRPPQAPPRLRAIEGGRAPVADAVLHRRRLVAAAAVVLLAALLVVGIATGFGFLLGAVRGGAAPSAPAPVSSAGAETVVVRPGDTLWSVSRRLHPEGDVRPTVDRLAEANGGAQIQPGQVLVLP